MQQPIEPKIPDALEAQHFPESGNGGKMLSSALLLAMAAALASCQTGPGHNGGYSHQQLHPAQIQPPLGLSPSPSYKPGGKITTLAQANIIANALAESYSDCGRKKVALTQQGLDMARYDFQRVTIFGSTYGQGENPQDASGKTIAWEDIAQWLGMKGWLDNHINQQAIIAQKNLASRGGQVVPQSTQPTQTAFADQAAQYYVGLYGSLAEASRPMPYYANLQPRTFRQHIVQQGETFSGIFKKYKIDRRVGWNWNSNNISNPHLLKPGMVLWIPVY